jgi:hypothetical protein
MIHVRCFPELGVGRESKSENGNSGLKQEQSAGDERGEAVRAARTDERTPPIPAPMCVKRRRDVELQAQIKIPGA